MIGVRKLSAEEVVRLAREWFRFSTQRSVDISMIGSSLSGDAYFDLLGEERSDVELAHLLLASAEKVDTRQFDRANKLLECCHCFSSRTGNAVQRVVHYFANALQERIERETGRIGSEGSNRKGTQPFHPEEAIMSLEPALMACFQYVPFYQVVQFAGIQAIVDSVTMARKVHVIDLGIKSGTQCTVLMQALTARKECPLELFKLTAVGTKWKQNIEETGKRLASFSETLNVPFLFRTVMISDIKDVNADLFELGADEAVAIYLPVLLRYLTEQKDRLVSLIEGIRNLNPAVVVVTEIEANHNSPVFMDRFLEALYYYSAYFDCLDCCMNRGDLNRITMEGEFASKIIENVVATEGEERIFRHMKIDGWREIFTGHGMVEIELSTLSLYQANLVLKQFACANFCRLDMNGKCLTVGWKGTPIFSVSAWKF